MNVENHMLSTYLIYSKEKSRILPGIFINSKIMFSCPRCKKEQDVPKHGIPGSCECGLYWYTSGNLLQISTSSIYELDRGNLDW